MDENMTLFESGGRFYYYDKNNRQNLQRAVVVAKAFPEICGEWFEGCEVHHIDHNSKNDDPYNLICLSKEEHHIAHSKSVIAFYDGRLYKRYTTVKDCIEDTGVSQPAISFYIKHNRPISNTYSKWRFAYC